MEYNFDNLLEMDIGLINRKLTMIDINYVAKELSRMINLTKLNLIFE